MQYYELSVLIDNLLYSTKQDWERTRFESYIQAQTQSTKRLAITDIIKFNWDKEQEKDTSVTKEDIDRLTTKMKLIEEKNKQ